MPVPKVLSKEQIEWIRSAKNYREAATKIGIGNKRAGRIKNAKTLEDAMSFVGTNQGEDMSSPPPDIPQKEQLLEENIPTQTSTTEPHLKSTKTVAIAQPPKKQTPVQITTRTVLELDIAQKKLQLFPEDIMRCWDEYRDMQELIGWQGDFSSALREGMKMLRAVSVHLTKGGNNDGREEGLSDGRVEDDRVGESS